jgi:hypothetical protein
MTDLGVSCLCLTYGRPHLLEEAIESFLRQTWNEGPKELIILNDHPEQTLRCDSDGVVVINLPRRLHTLGEKRNLCVALARYDNLIIWDDDDIYMPWRIEETMKKLPADHFFKCPNAWMMNHGEIDADPATNLFHGGTAYTRWLFTKAGGYSIMNGGEDADLENKFQRVIDKTGERCRHTALPVERLYYIYRWHHGSYHTTGCDNLEEIRPVIRTGEIILEPKWHLPYQELATVASAKHVRPRRKSQGPFNFIVFSKNRPLQLDGYIRSLQWALNGKTDLDMSVLYTCDDAYQDAYHEIIQANPWVNFVRQGDFHTNLLSLFNDSEFTCFGSDDVVFNGSINLGKIEDVMRRKLSFGFSLRLGKNISRSMFSGPMCQPENFDGSEILTWELGQASAQGDFGYSWELSGTVYPSGVALAVIEELKSPSPSLLEANGGGRWSKWTDKKLMSCFAKSKLIVATVNVVQTDFPNPVIGKPVSTQFLLDAWNCGLRLDLTRYRSVQNDCIHVGDLYLTNREITAIT